MYKTTFNWLNYSEKNRHFTRGFVMNEPHFLMERAIFTSLSKYSNLLPSFLLTYITFISASAVYFFLNLCSWFERIPFFCLFFLVHIHVLYFFLNTKMDIINKIFIDLGKQMNNFKLYFTLLTVLFSIPDTSWNEDLSTILLLYFFQFWWSLGFFDSLISPYTVIMRKKVAKVQVFYSLLKSHIIYYWSI